MSANPHVSICIVAFHNAEEIAGCIVALGQSTYENFDIVICENGGALAYAKLQSLLPQKLPAGQGVECLQAPGNLGYAGGVNLAMRARPDADAWWIVNPDTVPEPGALAALVDRLSRGDCHMVGGVLYNAQGRVQAYGGHWRFWLGRAVSIGMGARVDDPVDAAAVEAKMNYVLGASMLVDRHFVGRVGLMRDEYFLYCEEVEWGLRARKMGIKLGFAPDARVRHDQGGTTGSAGAIKNRKSLPIYMDERNKLHVVRDISGWRLPVAAAATLLLLSLRYGMRGAWRQWGYALSGWWAGIRDERGVPPMLAG
ncbi:MAG: glycosyltransferase family 2 protein [Sphingobium sp.]|nr:glycosyltransferase family 2 protein [Sphingobium sp.]MBP6112050.1 glycosyltransferase family 2 protein [Sphingobium sp.]MBP8669815.1 glycosyltransferase family 2 protein [Sphingobium sp.]MBP9156425.1 glycosyltransferase family 2 protein [Sphingobium sp.]MCC6482127.1 glycosyltransferase family 2 protein [Sphingomonadaceae bacterium]